MFFLLLCILLWALFAFKAPFDQYGWLMLVAAGWFFGFLDGRLYSKRDKDRDRAMPPGDETDRGEDATLFRS